MVGVVTHLGNLVAVIAFPDILLSCLWSENILEQR